MAREKEQQNREVWTLRIQDLGCNQQFHSSSQHYRLVKALKSISWRFHLRSKHIRHERNPATSQDSWKEACCFTRHIPITSWASMSSYIWKLNYIEVNTKKKENAFCCFSALNFSKQVMPMLRINFGWTWHLSPAVLTQVAKSACSSRVHVKNYPGT